MIELAKGYELTMKTVKTFNSDIDQKLVQNGEVLSEIGIFKSSEDSKYELEKQKILSREKVLMDEVKKHTNKLMKELDQRKKILVKSVNDAEKRSEKINKDLDFRKKNLSNALNSNNANQVFGIYLEEKTSRNQTIEHVETTFKKLPTFVPQKLEVKEFKFGSLVETNDDKKQFEFKVIKQYKTKLPLVGNLVCRECIHYLNTKDQLGVELPCSLDIDNTGTLYIGCSTYGSDKANIYTVQVSGF
ncbi:unnamed protein product [Mytilus edulis]|uniref:Uncharacterized protein n=1 Tax=Mytilus edulis TaxID=6550 RepID=A0A8S3V2J8_MYTED|nr:unnamed protein product [Mytilus edulis]